MLFLQLGSISGDIPGGGKLQTYRHQECMPFPIGGYDEGVLTGPIGLVQEESVMLVTLLWTLTRK